MPALTTATYLPLLALATAMSFSPGPNTSLSTALAANLGLRRTLPFCLAVPVGWTVLLLLCSLGLGAALQTLPAARLGLKAVGLGYLLWLAWQLSQVRRLGDLDTDRLHVGFTQGLLLQFVNIKAWMLALAVSTGWVLPGPLPERLLIVVPTMAAFAFASNFTYALMGAVLRHWLAEGDRLMWFNRSMAAVLVLTAGWMAAS